MKTTLVVNDVLGIGLKQTTLRLLEVALRRGHHVAVTGVRDLSCDAQGRVVAHARCLAPRTYPHLRMLLETLHSATPSSRVLQDDDLILMRTNPARDKSHAAWHQQALTLMLMVRDAGTCVFNDPVGLWQAGSKLYLQRLPAYVRPATLVSNQRAQILAFVEALNGPAVLKPLQGTRGNDVFMIDSVRDRNLNQIIDVLLRDGAAMVQSYVPEAVEGDTRVLVLNGEVMTVEGRPAAFRRIPRGSDFRSNVDVGGRTAPAVISDGMRAVVRAIGDILRRDGLWLVGLDFIGDVICEVNVFSPGGVRAAQKYEGVDFASALWQHLEARASTSQSLPPDGS